MQDCPLLLQVLTRLKHCKTTDLAASHRFGKAGRSRIDFMLTAGVPAPSGTPAAAVTYLEVKSVTLAEPLAPGASNDLIADGGCRALFPDTVRSAERPNSMTCGRLGST